MCVCVCVSVCVGVCYWVLLGVRYWVCVLVCAGVCVSVCWCVCRCVLAPPEPRYCREVVCLHRPTWVSRRATPEMCSESVQVSSRKALQRGRTPLSLQLQSGFSIGLQL